MSASDGDEERYRSLDLSKNEIRLLSFEDTTSSHDPVRVNLHYVSLNDWKPEYTAFRDQNASTDISQLSKEWSERVELPTLERSEYGDIYNIVTRFTWGDYTCLSYTWGDCEDKRATVFLDGIETPVTKHLEAALRCLRSGLECKLGMKVWVDALCVNQADLADRNEHVLRVKDMFGGAFSVTAWTEEGDDSHISAHEHPEEGLFLCDLIMKQYGRQALEELLGVRERDWGAAEEEDDQLRELVNDVSVLVFDQFHWGESDDEDDFGLGQLHLRDMVRMEMWKMLRKEYWSRLWIIQELAVSPTTATVCCGGSTLDLSTLQAVGHVLLTDSESGGLDPRFWEPLKAKLDLLSFISTWRASVVAGGLDDTTRRELNSLAARAHCSLPQDKVYGLLGLFPPSASGAVTVDYSRESAEVFSEFSSLVPGWHYE